MRRERYAAKSAAMTSLEKEAQRKKDRERKAIWRGKYSDPQNKKKKRNRCSKGGSGDCRGERSKEGSRDC